MPTPVPLAVPTINSTTGVAPAGAWQPPTSAGPLTSTSLASHGAASGGVAAQPGHAGGIGGGPAYAPPSLHTTPVSQPPLTAAAAPLGFTPAPSLATGGAPPINAAPHAASSGAMPSINIAANAPPATTTYAPAASLPPSGPPTASYAPTSAPPPTVNAGAPPPTAFQPAHQPIQQYQAPPPTTTATNNVGAPPTINNNNNNNNNASLGNANIGSSFLPSGGAGGGGPRLQAPPTQMTSGPPPINSGSVAGNDGQHVPPSHSGGHRLYPLDPESQQQQQQQQQQQTTTTTTSGAGVAAHTQQAQRAAVAQATRTTTTTTTTGGAASGVAAKCEPGSGAQCPAPFVRMTYACAPNTPDLQSHAAVPFGAVFQPLAPDADVPLVNFGRMAIPRCRSCRAYINPFVTWRENGRRWVPICCCLLEILSNLKTNKKKKHTHTHTHFAGMLFLWLE
jgi:protein transport protein SEC24